MLRPANNSFRLVELMKKSFNAGASTNALETSASWPRVSCYEGRENVFFSVVLSDLAYERK